MSSLLGFVLDLISIIVIVTLGGTVIFSTIYMASIAWHVGKRAIEK